VIAEVEQTALRVIAAFGKSSAGGIAALAEIEHSHGRADVLKVVGLAREKGLVVQPKALPGATQAQNDLAAFCASEIA
jgi:hypothetical protein